MENNDYYEPTIKTSRKNKKFKEDLLNVCSNFAKVSLDCIEKQNNELELLQQEKHQLISFLEDKIKECDKEIEDFLDREYYCIALDKKEAFQEVLDFINKGGKRMKKIFNNKKFIVTVGTILSFILGFIASIFIYRWLINFIIG